MKQMFTRDVCRIVETRPATTYDNFARDFGERFVPGYTRSCRCTQSCVTTSPNPVP